MATIHPGGAHTNRHRLVFLLRHILWPLGVAIVLIVAFGTAFGSPDLVLRLGGLILFWLGLLAIIAVAEK